MIFMVKTWETYDFYGENIGKTMIFMVNTGENYDLYGLNMGKL
jgi:hypothetical protein